MGRKPPAVAPEASDCLRCYDWPGNVRELQNALERAVVFGTAGSIYLRDLPEAISRSGLPVYRVPAGYKGIIEQFKRQVVLDAFEQAGGSFVGAAKILHIHPNYLHRLAQKLGLRKTATYPALNIEYTVRGEERARVSYGNSLVRRATALSAAT
jgi:DNA-binding NtrC family response regulator